MAASFGSLLRNYRQVAGRSQGWLAEHVGRDVSYISKLEHDRLPPPAADTILAISQALGTDATELLALSGKLPSAVLGIVATSRSAQALLRDAQQLRLTEAEWGRLRHALHRLRPPVS